jgi:flagellar hook-length control protein FliK
LDGKKNTKLDMDDFSKESRGFLKQLKSGTAKFSDHIQASASGGKTGETQANFDLLKTKASFKNLPAYVNQQVSRSLVRAINNGENTLKIQLKPPELGRLVMTIDNTGSTMKVGIITDNAAAKDILTSNVSELRTLLSNSGVNLEKFEVDMNSNFRQSMADTGNPAGNSGKRQRNREGHLIDPVNGEGVNDPAGNPDALSDGSLHFVA